MSASEGVDQPHKYKFGVTMTCSGCSSAVERVLGRLDGVTKYEVSLPSQTAEVQTRPDVSYETVLGKIKLTGKKVNSGWADGVAKAV